MGTKCSADKAISTVGRMPTAAGPRGPQVASQAVNIQKSTRQTRKHVADVSMCRRPPGTPRNKCGRRDLPEGKGGRSQ